jgi:hypothetical protein
VKPKDMAAALPNVDTDTIRRTCSRMAADGQLTKDAGGRYYPDTQSRTQGVPDVSELSDCPVAPSDQPEYPGQSEIDLSGLSGRPSIGTQALRTGSESR